MPATKFNLTPLYKLIATSLFTGYFPYGPGTVGSLLWIIFLWFLSPLSAFLMTLLAVVIFFTGAHVAHALVGEWGKDPSKINIDEAVGIIIALIGLPKDMGLWIAAFFLFRIIDIFKPLPIKIFEYLPGGWGIMSDDVVAGIYTNICCWLIIWLL